MEIHEDRGGRRLDATVAFTVNRKEQPELFAILKASNVPKEMSNGGNTLSITNSGSGSVMGNSHLTLSITGWELACLAEMLCPRQSNPLQVKMHDQIHTVAGGLVSMLRNMIIDQEGVGGIRSCWDETSPGAMPKHENSRPGAKCTRHEDNLVQLSPGLTRSIGCHYTYDEAE